MRYANYTLLQVSTSKRNVSYWQVSKTATKMMTFCLGLALVHRTLFLTQCWQRKHNIHPWIYGFCISTSLEKNTYSHTEVNINIKENSHIFNDSTVIRESPVQHNGMFGRSKISVNRHTFTPLTSDSQHSQQTARPSNMWVWPSLTHLLYTRIRPAWGRYTHQTSSEYSRHSDTPIWHLTPRPETNWSKFEPLRTSE